MCRVPKWDDCNGVSGFILGGHSFYFIAYIHISTKPYSVHLPILSFISCVFLVVIVLPKPPILCALLVSSLTLPLSQHVISEVCACVHKWQTRAERPNEEMTNFTEDKNFRLARHKQ